MSECLREVIRLRGVVRELEDEIENYKSNMKSVLQKYFTDKVVEMILEDYDK